MLNFLDNDQTIIIPPPSLSGAHLKITGPIRFAQLPQFAWKISLVSPRIRPTFGAMIPPDSDLGRLSVDRAVLISGPWPFSCGSRGVDLWSSGIDRAPPGPLTASRLGMHPGVLLPPARPHDVLEVCPAQGAPWGVLFGGVLHRSECLLPPLFFCTPSSVHSPPPFHRTARCRGCLARSHPSRPSRHSPPLHPLCRSVRVCFRKKRVSTCSGC